MGRKPLETTKKVQIGARVDPRMKRAIERLAEKGQHTESQAIAILLAESPRLKAELRMVR